MFAKLDLSPWGITRPSILRNPVPAVLYEKALKHDAAAVSSAGALITSSAAKTGRSPKDKRIVETPDCVNDVWWGDVNIKLSEASFNANRQRAIDYLNSRDELFGTDRTVKATLADPDAQVSVFDIEGNVSQSVNLEDVAGVKLSLDFFPTLIFCGFAHR